MEPGVRYLDLLGQRAQVNIEPKAKELLESRSADAGADDHPDLLRQVVYSS